MLAGQIRNNSDKDGDMYTLIAARTGRHVDPETDTNAKC